MLVFGVGVLLFCCSGLVAVLFAIYVWLLIQFVGIGSYCCLLVGLLISLCF